LPFIEWQPANFVGKIQRMLEQEAALNNFRNMIIRFTMNACRPFLVLLILFFASCNNSGPDLILLNGKIWTAEGEDTFVEALAIKGNEIIQIGTQSDIQGLKGSNTRIIDLQGKLVIPGFNDAHIHFLGGSQELAEVDLTGAMSGAGIVKAVEIFASRNTGKNWITGRGWQYIWFQSGLPTNEDMEGMIADRPVFIKAYDGHSAWANKKALELAGITGKSTPEGFGEVVLDSNGNPTGALLEGAQSLVTAIIPKLSQDEKLNALRSGLKMAARLGITSMQNASGSVEELNLYKELQNNNELTVRYSAALSVDETTDPKEMDAYRIARKEMDASPSLIKADAINLIRRPCSKTMMMIK
jgi:predicted amidohydrolase YtcJ